MIKMIIAGVWVCVVTLGAAYGAYQWQANAKPVDEAKKSFNANKEAVKTRMISVPMIRDGGLQGYVMAMLTFTIDSKLNKEMPIKAQEYVLDEAFKVIYSDADIDFKNFKKQDLASMSKAIADNINKRFGANLVDDVLIQELNYLPKEQARGGGKK